MSLPSGSKKLAKVIAILAASALIATIGVAYALDQINRYGDVPCSPEASTHQASGGNKAAALFIDSFTSLEQIAQNSDAVVIADVDSCIKIHSHPKSKEIRLTDFEVTVRQSVRGDLPADRTLTVQLETSGMGADYHIMRQGEQYVLFLAYNQITSSYMSVGGPQGRFMISDGLVYSLDALYSDVGFINVKVDGQPLQDFLSDIQSVS